MDKLIIKKEDFASEAYMKTLKVSTDLHSEVKALADKTNQPINKIACLLVEFALERVKIEE